MKLFCFIFVDVLELFVVLFVLVTICRVLMSRE